MADTDVLTRDEADAALKIGATDTSKDPLLDSYITTVSALLDGICGPIVRRTVTDELHEMIAPRTGDLFLKLWPVTSVASVTEYDSAGAPTVLAVEDFDTKPNDGYWLEPYRPGSAPYSGRMYRRSYGGPAWFGPSLKATYVTGRYQNTAAVAPLFKDCAKLLLRDLWVTVDPQSVFVETSGFEYPLRRMPSRRVLDEFVAPMLAAAGEYHRQPVLA